MTATILNTFYQTTPYSLLVQSLIKQLCKFIETDNQRSTELYNKICEKLHEMKFIDESYEKSEFENIRSSYELALKNLVEATRQEETLPMGQQQLDVWPLSSSPKSALEWSRYFKDFSEIEKIGEGGFGDVWRSRHNLDGIDYAVKKIRVKATSVKNILNHLREVKTLASLSHMNIVPYKSCWLEPWTTFHDDQVDPIFNQTETSEASSITRSYSKYQKDSLRLKSDSFQIDFQDSEEKKSTVKSVGESFARIEKLRELNGEKGALIPHVKLAWAILYIQMKLCEKTLRNYLDDRNNHHSFSEFYAPFLLIPNEPFENVPMRMFLQMCNGLAYIHSKGIVHHDIKPSNVFITQENENMTLQLGDFGLACPLEGNDSVRHDGFGTRLYAAPEQLQGQCTKKSDIYSLGVIMIELMSKCVTMMECYKKVEIIKKSCVIDEIGDDLCKGLLKNLLSHRVEKRPCIEELTEIIRHRISYSPNEIEKLKRVISERDDEIQQKDQKIEELLNEIMTLKRRISNEN